MHPTPPLTTPRLLLEPLQITDAPALQPLFAHWEIVRFLNDQVPWPYPADGTLCHLRERCLPAMALGTEWHWSIRLRTAPDTPIGCISLTQTPDNQRGFWLGQPWQGKGYMTEACTAVDRFWFMTLDQPSLRVMKAAPNEASRRLSARAGMRLLGSSEGSFVGGRLTRELWEITRTEWLERQHTPAPDTVSD